MLIPTLKLGDEVMIGANAGYPAKETPHTDIILSVSGFSAITADGVLLSCDDDSLVTKTGRQFAWGEFRLSDEVHAVLHELGLTVDMTNGEVVAE